MSASTNRYIILNLSNIISVISIRVSRPFPWLTIDTYRNLREVWNRLRICLNDIEENRLNERVSFGTVKDDLDKMEKILKELEEYDEEELNEEFAIEIKKFLEILSDDIRILIENLREGGINPPPPPPPIRSIPVLRINSKEYPIKTNSIILGRREEDNHLLILNKDGRLIYDTGVADPYISRYKPREDRMGNTHIYYNNGRWCIVDLKSTNGTKVNNIDILHPTELKNGDIIEIGYTKITFIYS